MQRRITTEKQGALKVESVAKEIQRFFLCWYWKRFTLHSHTHQLRSCHAAGLTLWVQLLFQFLDRKSQESSHQPHNCCPSWATNVFWERVLEGGGSNGESSVTPVKIRNIIFPILHSCHPGTQYVYKYFSTLPEYACMDSGRAWTLTFKHN